jgi:hypothetical protein
MRSGNAKRKCEAKMQSGNAKRKCKRPFFLKIEKDYYDRIM